MIENPTPICVSQQPTREERFTEARRDLTETPIVQFTMETIEKLNTDILGGAGTVGWGPGEDGLVGLEVLWGWEGRETKGKTIKIRGKEIKILPFSVCTTVVKDRDNGQLYFKSTGRFYSGEYAEDISLGRTADLDLGQLTSNIRRKKSDILESRKR